MENGFPNLSDSFLAGQDIFYTQFNEISFYIEDTEQEHLYFNILRRVFPDISLDKYFRLMERGMLRIMPSRISEIKQKCISLMLISKKF